jgi:predicted heme/steroid binding protein
MNSPRNTTVISLALAGLVVLAFMAGCGGSTTSTTTAPKKTSTSSTPASGKTFTVEELAKSNGQNGQPAYIAVDGVVYDVTGSSFWAGGNHSVCPQNSMAGKDLSEAIKSAPPRMRSNLERFPVVGSLTQ